MALDERYFLFVPMSQPFIDKNSGLPLANGTLTFYRDTARTELKAVYQLSGACRLKRQVFLFPLGVKSRLVLMGRLKDAGVSGCPCR